MHRSKKMHRSGQCTKWSWDVFLASTVFGWNRPRDTPSSNIQPPSNLLSSHNLWNQPLNYPQPPGPANTIVLI